MSKWRYILPILALVIISCKKKDDEPPILSITGPNENSTHRVLESTNVTGSVTDNVTVESIKVTLKKSNGSQVLDSKTIYPGTPSVNFQIPFAFDDINLEAGNYYFQITASDGVHSKSAFLNIVLEAIPLRLKKVWYVWEDVLQTRLYKVDSLWNDPLFYGYTGDYMRGAIVSRQGFIGLAADTVGDLHLIDTETANANVVSGSPNPPFPMFQYIYADQELIQVSHYVGHVRGYDYGGTINDAVNTDPGRYPGAFARGDDYIVSEETERAGGNIKLVSYFASTGIEAHNTAFQYADIVDLYMASDQHAIAFSTDGTDSYVCRYDATTNFNSLRININGKVVQQVLQKSGDDYYVLIGGELHLYNNTGNSLVQLNAGPYSSIAYDFVNNVVYAANGSTINVLLGTNGAVSSTHSMSHPVSQILLQYNY